jgi:hypothetical protein
MKKLIFKDWITFENIENDQQWTIAGEPIIKIIPDPEERNQSMILIFDLVDEKK